MVVEIQTRCCGQCKPCSCDFKKVIDLPYSGLVIYIYTKQDDQNESTFDVRKGIIFHNTTDKELSKSNYLSELSQYKTKYSHTKIIIKRVRSLLDEIVVIKGNQVIGICEHCIKANTTKKCRKCTCMVREFLTDKKKIIKEKQKRFKEWLLKVKHLLQSILNAHSVCKHMAYKDTELERILRELKTPLSMRIPDIDSFPNIEGDQIIVTQSIIESKEMLDELLSRIQSEGIAKPLSSNDSLYPSVSDFKETCICKLVKEGLFLENEISTWATDKTETDLIDSISEADFKKENAIFLTDLLQRLQDLKSALVLDPFKTADKVLIQNLLKSINCVHKQGLLPAYTKNLIDQISQLSKEVSFDGKAGERYKSLIDSLLTDLKKHVIMTDGVSKHLLKALSEICTRTADQFSKGASKDKLKESRQALLKDHVSELTKQIEKETGKALPKGPPVGKQIETLSKDTAPGLNKDETGKALPKGPPAGKQIETLSKDTAPGLNKDARNKKSEKDAHDDLLRQKLLELGRALHQGLSQVLDKELVRDLSNNVKQIITKDIQNITQGVIGALTDVCKVLAEGIPKNLNKGPVIDILGDMNEILPRGLSSDQNKEKLEMKLRELGKALTQTITKETNKEEMSGIKSKSVTTGHRTPLSKGTIKEKSMEPSLQKPKIGATSEPKSKPDTSGDLTLVSKGPTKVQASEKIIQKTKKMESSGIKNKTDVSGDVTSVSKGTTKKTPQEKSKKEDLSKYVHEAQNKMQKKNELKKISKPITDEKIAEDKNKSKEEIGKKQVKEEKPIKDIKKSKDDKPSKVETGTKDEKDAVKGIKKSNKEEKPIKEIKKSKDDKPSKVVTETKDEKDAVKEIKKSKTQDDLLFAKLVAQIKATREHERKEKKDIQERKAILSMKSLPKLPEVKIVQPIKTDSIETDSSQSFDYGQADTKYIVIGTSLKSRTRSKQEPEITAKPASLLKKEIVLDGLEEIPEITFKEFSEKSKVLDTVGTAVIRYRLSDREFIDNGWTKLPMKKIMRRMNIYRMHPANPQYDWFKRNQEKKVMFYDTGERLAEVTDDGRGKWYYKNGALALDYYNAEEMLVGQRYIVYSSGEECENGRRKPPTVLALFDFLGNGVVYDYNGNVRLKYNQSEGVIVDPKIGPPSRWKWHTLNEPPVLQQVFVNSHLAIRDPFIEKLGHHEVKCSIDNDTKEAQSVMLQIELDNFVKEKSQKLMQQFKPFQIKMKAMKLNEQFSLKILNQANISLIFRDGRTSLKLNLGMNLNNHEIIDTDISDATDVSTPYDKFPARTDSVANVQSILQSIRKANKPNLKSFSSFAEMSQKIS